MRPKNGDVAVKFKTYPVISVGKDKTEHIVTRNDTNQHGDEEQGFIYMGSCSSTVIPIQIVLRILKGPKLLHKHVVEKTYMVSAAWEVIV